jgi:hypothetical protein
MYISILHQWLRVAPNLRGSLLPRLCLQSPVPGHATMASTLARTLLLSTRCNWACAADNPISSPCPPCTHAIVQLRGSVPLFMDMVPQSLAPTLQTRRENLSELYFVASPSVISTPRRLSIPTRVATSTGEMFRLSTDLTLEAPALLRLSC